MIRLPSIYLRFLFLALVFFTACKSDRKFEPSAWSEKVNGNYPNRKGMLDDLVNTQPLKNLPYTDLKNLLGIPDRIDTTGGTTLYYNVSTKNTDGSGETERLLFRLNDSLKVQDFSTSPDPR